MKNRMISQEDGEGWKTIKSKKSVSSGNPRSLLNKNGLCYWIEAKGFSFSKGYGSKSGKFQIIEAKGDRFSTLWINQKGLSWFQKGLITEISKSWSKSQVWQFSDQDDWLTVTRGRNNNGEYMKLSGPNSWGNTVDIYFLAGSHGEGWNQIVTIISQLVPVQKISHEKLQPLPVPTISPNPSFVWSNPNKPQVVPESNPVEKENWNHLVVLSADSELVSWEAVGNYLGKSLEKNEEFFLQPMSNSKAMFKVQNTEMRNELFSKSTWVFNDINFSFIPWSSKLNLLSDEDILKIQSCWIEVQGVPLSLWNQKTFETVGAKCGGLLEVSEDTKNGYNLSIMKLKVRGPVENVPKIAEVNFKLLPFKALINRAEDQSPSISNGLHRIKISNVDSVVGEREEGPLWVFSNSLSPSDTSRVNAASKSNSTSRVNAVSDKGKSNSILMPDKRKLKANASQSRASDNSNSSCLIFKAKSRPLAVNEGIVEGQIRDVNLRRNEVGSSSASVDQDEWARAKSHGTFPAGFFNTSLCDKKTRQLPSDSPSDSKNSVSYLCGNPGILPDDYTSDSSVERGELFARFNLEAARDSIEDCNGYPSTAHCCAERGFPISNSGSPPNLAISIPSSSASPQSSAGNSRPNPPFSPSGEFFMQALSDPEKEAMVISYLDSKYHTAFEFIKKVGLSMNLGLPQSDYDFIKVLMHAASQNPTAFNFECRESLRDSKRRGVVKRWIALHNPNLIVFQETLLESCSDSIVRHIWGDKACNWLALDSIGRSGGILVIWNPNKLLMESHIIGTFSVNIQFKNLIDNFVWLFSGVYGPCDVLERKRLWEELSLMNTIWSLPWCIGRDFNEVRLMDERKGCTNISSGMRDFGEFYDSNVLIDIPISEAKYTWVKRGSLSSRSKIDKFLVTADWDDHFPGILVKALGRPFSDHKPILLSCDLEDWGAPPWRCESMWLLEPGFIDLLEQWWLSLANVYSGSSGFILAKKLQALKGKIKDWNKIFFGKLDRKCEQNYLLIQWLDQKIDEDDISHTEIITHDNLMLESEKLADMKEQFWRDKSRIQWNEEGDRNTSYYHRIAKIRRRRNTFSSIKIDSVLVEDKLLIKNSILDHFSSRFKLSDTSNVSVGDMDFKSLSAEDAAMLERPILENEVISALKLLGQNRAPGPDGFQVGIIVKCWNFMKDDIMKVVKDFEATGKIDWRLKSTFLALIPKKPVVEEIKDLRPISLTNTIYKAISKILAEILKVMLPKLVSNQQSAFVKGRQILDSILVANELLDSRIKLGSPGIVCKIDLEKAFDNFKWSFLMEVLQKMGFGRVWKKWIYGCIARVPFSVLINGSAFGKFTSEKGLRQGDPLSPFLFLLVSEVLTMMFQKAETDGLLGGFLSSSSTNAIKVSHLQFADDTLVFLDDNVEQIRNLKYILLWFQCISGLKTNFSKCNLFGVGNVQDIDGLAEIMGCSCDSFPTQYLGMPLGDKANSAAKWDMIVELCKARLASWKRKTLTRAGWKNVHKTLKFGGLGIRSLKHLNRSLLQKWWWRLGNEPKALWSRVVKDKHGVADLGWRTNKPMGKHSVSLWRNIYSTAEDFFKLCQFKIGKGDRVRLWEDKWCINGPISSLCPNLFRLSTSKNISILQAHQANEDGFNWVLGLDHRRRLYDAEISELTVLIPLLESIIIIPDQEDQLIYLGDKKGTFSVKAAYANLSQGTDHVIPFPCSKVWSRAWPHRVGFFLWQVCLNRLPTLSNLHKRRSALTSPNLCYLCGAVEETEDHLVIQCPLASRVWNYFISLVDDAPLPQNVKDVIVGWKHSPLPAQGIQLWKRLPAAITWGLWKARNAIAFSGKTFKLNEVIRDIKIDTFNWSKGLDCFKGINTSNVIVGWAQFFSNPR